MTTTVTDPSVLPQHNGRPVPWITRWDGEVDNTLLQASKEIGTNKVFLSYADGRENREKNGILWKREGITRAGRPQYSEVNTYRQRAAMDKCLCQVCGSKIDERPIRWLMSKRSFNEIEDGKVATDSPPTCSACIPLALELCPHLKTQGYMIVKVLEYQAWGVWGAATHYDPETGKGRDVQQVYIPYEGSPFNPEAIVAYQRVVEFTKYVIEEVT